MLKSRVIVFIFIAVAAAAFFAIPSAAAVYEAEGYVFCSADPSQPSGLTAVIPDGSDVEALGDAGEAERTVESFGEAVSAAVPAAAEKAERKAEFSVSGQFDLSAYGALEFSVFPDLPADPGAEAGISVLVISARDQVVFTEKIVNGRACRTVFDISGMKDRTAIERISVTVSWQDAGDRSGRIVFSRLFGSSGAGLPAVSDLSALSIRTVAGEAEAREDGFAIRTEDGEAAVYLRIDPESVLRSDGDEDNSQVRYAVLTVTGVSGSLFADLGAGEEAAEKQSQTIYSGTHVYLFRAAYGVPATLKITLRGRDGEKYVFSSLRFVNAGRVDHSIGEVGCTADLSLTGGTLRVEGKLKKSTAVEYMGKKIGLLSEPAAGGDAVLLASGRAGSSFTLSAPESSLPGGGRENYYWVALLTDDGENVPLSEKRFLSTAPVSEGDATVFGLYGAEPAGAFEAAMNRVMVDVELDAVTGGDRSLTSGLAAIRNSETYYLNDEYVRKLDADMEFYSAAGISVYLRFRTAEPSAWFSDGRGAEDGDRRGLNLYLALVSFLCGRYRNVATVVIPDASQAYPRDVWGRAENAALLARLTYAAASGVSEHFIVTVPVNADEKDGEPELFAALVAEAMAEKGQVRWSLMCFSSEASLDFIDRSIASARANGTAAPSFSAIVWIPSKVRAASAADIYAALGEKARTSGSKAVVLSLENIGKGRLIDYSKLRVSGSGGKGVVECEALEAEDVLPSVTAGGVIWDFSDSYSGEGWVSGSGIGSCGTAYKEGRSGDRVLRFTLDKESSHGILLRTLHGAAWLSQFPLVEFDFSVDASDDAYVTFMFGGEDGRREFEVAFPAGKTEKSIVCDAGSAAAGTIGYVSILVRSEGVVTVDLSRVTAHSRTADPSTVFQLTQGPDGPGRKSIFDGENRVAVTVVLAVAAIALIWLAIHSFRSDRDAYFRKKAKRKETNASNTDRTV